MFQWLDIHECLQYWQIIFFIKQKEMLKHTPKGHPDMEGLQSALGTVSEMASFVDEACQKAENIQKIIDISRAINMVRKFSFFTQKNNKLLLTAILF